MANLCKRNIPQELMQVPRWVCWKYRHTDGAKPAKMPVDPKSGGPAKTNDPETWGTFAQAIQAYEKNNLAGIGLVFTKDDDFTAVDLDNCVKDGVFEPWAEDLVLSLDSYAEFSPSGTGVHIIVQATVDDGLGKRITNAEGQEIEIYPDGQFLTFTGNVVGGGQPRPIAERTSELVEIRRKWAGVAASTVGATPDDDERRLEDDLALLRGRAFKAKNGEQIRALFEDGDTGDYGDDQSAADLALCNSLAFWLGKDAERIDAVFRESALFRGKWDRRHYGDGRTYGQGTIDEAVRTTREVYSPNSPGKGAEINEIAAAERFAREQAERLRFDHDMKRWFMFDGARWKIDNEEAVREPARQLCSKLAKEAGKKKGQVFQKTRTVSNVLNEARSIKPLNCSTHIWDANPWMLGTPQGLMDLKTGQAIQGGPEHHVTKLAGASPSTVGCDQWLRFLDQATGGDGELKGYLQKMVGYCLTGDMTEQCLFFMYGRGGTGKSVFINTTARLLGEYATTAMTSVFEKSKFDRHPAELAALKGARLVTANETERGRHWKEAQIKAITGGDRITAHFMRQDPFTFHPVCKILIASNHAPQLQSVDDSMKRRLHVIPMNRKPENPDPRLEEKLRRELPAIMSWAIQGCLAWQREGLAKPQAVAAATGEYFEDQDFMGQFLSEYTQRGPEFVASTQEVFEQYQKFVRSRGGEPGTQKDVNEEIERLGFKKERKRINGASPKMYFVGFQLEDFHSGNTSYFGAVSNTVQGEHPF